MVGDDRMTYLHRSAESRRPTTFGSALEHLGGLSGAGRAASLRTSRAGLRVSLLEHAAQRHEQRDHDRGEHEQRDQSRD